MTNTSQPLDRHSDSPNWLTEHVTLTRTSKEKPGPLQSQLQEKTEHDSQTQQLERSDERQDERKMGLCFLFPEALCY